MIRLQELSARGPRKIQGAIVDRSQLYDDHSDERLASTGVPVLVDTVPGLMHNKIMIIDDATVLTGSFNYIWSAAYFPA